MYIFGIWDWGLANSLWDHVIQISIRQISSKIYMYLPNHQKLKSFVKTFTPYNQMLIFEEQLCMSNIDFIFDTD